MTINFYDNNTVSGIGNYRIVTISETLRGVTSIMLYEDVVTGGAPGAMLKRSFRYTYDGSEWSLWTDFDESNPAAITEIEFDPKKPLLLQFKFTGAQDETSSPPLQLGDEIDPPFTISNITIGLAITTETGTTPDPYQGYTPPSACSDEFCQVPIIRKENFTFNPYAVNNAICLYKELSGMTNELFGHEVVYYRVNPQKRSADVFLKEWTIFNVEQHKCVKILVPNNEFPDSKPQYNTFGVDFELPFEIHIDKGYWDSNFGIGSMPQELDVVYFPLLNRVYEVQSTYVYRDFMQQPLYFKALLVKYQQRAAVLMPDNIAKDLDDLTLTTDELFAEANEKEVERTTKPQQFITITTSEDPTRSSLNSEIRVVPEQLYSNWVLVSEYYYDFDSLYKKVGGMDAVIYRANAFMGAKDNRSFAFWFKPVGNPGQRPLIKSDGLELDLTYGAANSITLTFGGNPYSFPMPGITLENKWYAVVVNVSNQFGQAGVTLWEPKDNVGLVKRYNKTKNIAKHEFATETPWKLVASPIHLTNVRIFGTLMEEEKQSIVLAQLVVQDSDKALVIDNARPLLKIPKMVDPK